MILQVFDPAGVASLYSKLLNREGIKSLCIYSKRKDPYQISEYYSNQGYSYGITGSCIKEVLLIFIILLKLKPKIIHLHYHQFFVVPFRLVCFFIGARLLFTYHGSDQRLNGYRWTTRKFAHYTTAVTPDLYADIVLINPVDQELFFPVWCGTKILTEIKTELPYQYLAYYLSEFGTYCDYKGFQFPILSKTAMEALAVGLVVRIGTPEKFVEVFPGDIDFNAIENEIIQFYRRILN